ncbi:ENTH domain-containing protein 1 [Rhynchocyon petersi]
MAFRRQVKNFVKNYSDAEIKVREATSNDPWGPSSSLMLDISDLTFNTISLSEIMNILWQRLSDHGKNWRHVYKSLTLMDYLIKNGSQKVSQQCKEKLYNLQTLKEFQHIDEAGKDQGYYIREKSKQVITLLMDEQLLHKEREVACRTRRRTSYSMTLSKRLPGTENTSKAGLNQEPCQNVELPGESPLAQGTPSLKINAWKSTEDLLLLCDDDPAPLLPTIPPSVVSSTMWMSEGEEEVCNLWDADSLPTSSGKSPSLQTNVSLDKQSDSATADTVLEQPLEKQPAAHCTEALTTSPAFWSSSKEEFTSPSLRVSKSESAFYNQASVETLFLSPSFQTSDPVKEVMVSKGSQKPAPSSTLPMDKDNLQPLTTWVSTVSEGTASLSAVSVSSPGSASSEKSAPLFSPVLAGPSFQTLDHQPSSLASIEDKEKTTRGHQCFASKGPVAPDEDENNCLSVLEILPDNSDSAKKETTWISSSQWVEFSTQNVDHFTSVSCASFQTTKGLPREPESNNPIAVLLGEVKNAVVRLHDDLSMVIQELHVISSHLGSMSGNTQQMNTSSEVTQSSEGGSDQI